MWTSRATWQKALLLSRKPKYVPVLLAVLFLGVPVSPAAQQSGGPENEVSILQRGPIYRKGLPFFLPNAIPGFYGVYRFRGTEITVYYTETAISRRQQWEAFNCPASAGFILPEEDAEERVLFIFPAEEQGWTVFFLFREVRDDTCLFIDTFFSRFQYFRGITRDRSIPPFPAVLPLQ